MKYIKFYNHRILSLLFIACFTIISAQKKFTIVLDPGHGGSDTGATSSFADVGTLREKDITLSITLKLGAMLEKNKDFKIIYTRKIDEYPSLTDRTDLANRSKADLFVSIHCNSASRSTAYGTETFVQGPDQNKTNLEVAKRENDVIFLDAKDRENFASYDPTSPESLIALKLQQSKYLEASLMLGGLVEGNFVNNDHRFSRGVQQKNLHVLRMNAMPSVLIETGFINNPEESHYIASEKGQNEIALSIYNAVTTYQKAVAKKRGTLPAETKKIEKLAEQPLKNDFRILLMSTPIKYAETDPALKGLKNITVIKEGNLYKYYYGVTNYASIRDINIKTARDAGFRNSSAVGFMPNQKIATGFYTLELAAVSEKLPSGSPILALKDVQRDKESGIFYYTYGNFGTLEAAISARQNLEAKGLKNIAIARVNK